MAYDVAVRAGDKLLDGGDELEDLRLAADKGRRSNNYRRCSVAAYRLPHEVLNVRLARAAKPDGGDLGADGQDAGAGVVLGDVFGQAEDCAPAEAAHLVEHEALGRGWEPHRPQKVVVGAGHLAPPLQQKMMWVIAEAGRPQSLTAESAAWWLRRGTSASMRCWRRLRVAELYVPQRGSFLIISSVKQVCLFSIIDFSPENIQPKF